jgi:hypothetical protein
VRFKIANDLDPDGDIPAKRQLLFAHRIQEGNLRLRKKPWCSGRTDSNGRAQEREGEMTLIA